MFNAYGFNQARLGPSGESPALSKSGMSFNAAMFNQWQFNVGVFVEDNCFDVLRISASSEGRSFNVARIVGASVQSDFDLLRISAASEDQSGTVTPIIILPSYQLFNAISFNQATFGPATASPVLRLGQFNALQFNGVTAGSGFDILRRVMATEQSLSDVRRIVGAAEMSVSDLLRLVAANEAAGFDLNRIIAPMEFDMIRLVGVPVVQKLRSLNRENPSLGIDIRLDGALSWVGPEKGDIALTVRKDLDVISDVLNVRQALFCRLNTPKGNLWAHPDYGCGVWDILSEPMSDDWYVRAMDQIRDCINREPRTKLMGITYEAQPEQRIVLFTINYQIIDGRKDNLVWTVNPTEVMASV